MRLPFTTHLCPWGLVIAHLILFLLTLAGITHATNRDTCRHGVHNKKRNSDAAVDSIAVAAVAAAAATSVVAPLAGVLALARVVVAFAIAIAVVFCDCRCHRCSLNQ